jgi:hypothetical protein
MLRPRNEPGERLKLSRSASLHVASCLLVSSSPRLADTRWRTPITTHSLWLTPQLFTATGILSSSRSCSWRRYTTPVANRNLHEEECLALVDKQLISTIDDTSILTQSHHTALLRLEASLYSILCPSPTRPTWLRPALPRPDSLRR